MHSPFPFRREELLENLELAIEYFDNRADCDDGRPNIEMVHQVRLEDLKMCLQRLWEFPVDDRGYYPPRDLAPSVPKRAYEDLKPL
jgi:hypothetical protein